MTPTDASPDDEIRALQDALQPALEELQRTDPAGYEDLLAQAERAVLERLPNARATLDEVFSDLGLDEMTARQRETYLAFLAALHELLREGRRA